MIFSSNLLHCLHLINFCSTFSINLLSDIIYSSTSGTSADVPCRTPLRISVFVVVVVVVVVVSE